MQTIKFTILVILSILFFNACDEKEAIPAYLTISNIDFQITNPGEQGSASEAITDVWVYSGGNFLGVHDINDTFPILAEGLQDIVMFAGIAENGIRSTRVIYPFYTRDSAQINLIKGEVATLSPSFTYNENAEFLFVEDFEGSHIFTEDLDENLETQVNVTTTEVFEGVQSGHIELDTTNNNLFILVGSNNSYNDFDISNPIYLEFNYKNDYAFSTGLVAENSDGTSINLLKLTLTPTTEWKKVYVSLLPEVRLNGSNASYKIAFHSLLPLNADSEITKANIYLDNIKLIRY